jgi:succinate-acetate transporter protein
MTAASNVENRRKNTMAEESNVHVKVAMADVMALFVIAFFTFLVGGLGLGVFDQPAILASIAVPVGILVLVATIITYLNENVLGTAIFGPLAVFFLVFPFIPADSAGMLALVYIGLVMLIDTVLSLAQPVRLLPIVLFIAAIAFIVTGLWYNGGATDATLRTAAGVLWMVFSLLGMYLATGIVLLVMKGKQVVPIGIPSAPAASKA